MLIRVCSAYKTISVETVSVNSDTPPVKIIIENRKPRYRGVAENLAREILMESWRKNETEVKRTDGLSN